MKTCHPVTETRSAVRNVLAPCSGRKFILPRSQTINGRIQTPWPDYWSHTIKKNLGAHHLLLKDGCSVRSNSSPHPMKLTLCLIAYKRHLGLTTSKTLVSTSALDSSRSHRGPDQSKGEDYTDENGIRTIVEYTVNEDGKKVKVRRGHSTPCFCPFLFIIRPDHKKNQANSPKITGGACGGREKNVGQVRA